MRQIHKQKEFIKIYHRFASFNGEDKKKIANNNNTKQVQPTHTHSHRNCMHWMSGTFTIVELRGPIIAYTTTRLEKSKKKNNNNNWTD